MLALKAALRSRALQSQRSVRTPPTVGAELVP
jgi:hypothetical protein